MEIRAAQWTDLAAIVECEARGFGTPPRQLGSDGASAHAKLLGQIRAGEIAVISQGSAVLGFISVAAQYEHLYVAAIAVLPEHQRRGLGSRLLVHAERQGARCGLAFVSLSTDGSIAANMAFYRHHGYRETERCEAPNFSRVYFSKAIGAPAGLNQSGPAQAA